MPSRASPGTANAASPPVSKQVRFRQATFDDYSAIYALESRHGLETKTYEQWTHLWINNPAYKQVRDLPIGWVLEDEQSGIVASVGSIPLRYELNGRQLIASAGHSWVADEPYRGYALMLLNQLMSQPAVDLYLSTSVSANSQASFEALDCVRVPAGAWDHAAFWIADYRAFAGSALAKMSIPFASILRYPLSAAIILHDKIKRNPLRRAASVHDVKACPAFDDRFDDFWAMLRARNPHRLLALRNREALEWHFKYSLAQERAWIFTVCDGPHVTAYSIFRRRDESNLGLRRVQLVDFQSADGDTTLLRPMLGCALERCEREGISMVEVIGWRLEKGDLIDGLAAHQRILPSWLYFYKTYDAALATSLKDRNVWDPCHFDGDSTL